MQKVVWSSKWVFILAAIGAAAGLGNLWRFPYMVYENGGGAFLFAYLLILLVIGIPLVMMEVAFGQKSQTEVVEAFGRVGKWFGRFVGWFLIAMLCALAGYYAVILGWGFDFLYLSPSLAWGADAQNYFHQNVLHLTEDGSVWGGFSKPVLYGLVAAYLAVYFSIFKGLKSVGAVVKWTVPLPFLLLAILLVNTMSLEGAREGFAYFFIPEWGKLTEVKVWRDALSQAFFSMNIGFALTVLYASFNKQKTNIVQSALWIALGDVAVSVVAGFAMFGTLGWMSVNQGIPIEEVVQSGVTLAFVTFPTALALLPFGAKFFAVIFFLAILTLGIDSMFAVLETISASIKRQFRWFGKFKNEVSIGIICAIFFCWSLAFAGGNGLYRLDIIDHFFFTKTFYFAAVAQLIMIGWLLPVDDLRQYINTTSKFQLGRWFNALIKFFAPAVLIFLYISTLGENGEGNYGGYSDEMIFSWGILPVVIAVTVSFLLAFRSVPKEK
mgnify:CR=1 FL=1